MLDSRRYKVKVSLWGVAALLFRSLLLIQMGAALGALGMTYWGGDIMRPLIIYGIAAWGMLLVLSESVDKTTVERENP